MGNIDSLVSQNRIFCVDPNDIFTVQNQDGSKATVTPDYTDYSIWCNLVVERVSRLKNQANGTDESGTYSLSYDLTKKNGEFVSFLRGADVEKYNFLTTDYTDYDFNTVMKKNSVEGLQIESIKVSFINNNSPLVTIKFIDIRGCGFFGREEATHDEYGHLSNLEKDSEGNPMDNIFGCFSEVPYPRFKLQIKGFYGKAVTYQLTCCGFEGNFNSTTGNFEITTKFMGYEYGILGDIPFAYIVAAPLTKIGSEYWDKHVNSKAWSLTSEAFDSEGNPTNGHEPPIKLVDFFNNIDAAISESEEAGNDVDELLTDNDVMASYTERISMLNELKIMLAKLKLLIINTFGGEENIVEVTNGDTDIMVVFGNSIKMNSSTEINNLRNAYGRKVDEYMNRFYEYDSTITSTMVPNSDANGNWKDWDNTVVEFGKYMKYTQIGSSSSDSGNQADGQNIACPNVLVDDNGDSIGQIKDEESCLAKQIRLFGSKEYKSVTPSLSKALYEALGSSTSNARKKWSINGKSGYKGNAAMIDFGNSTQRINDTLTNLEIDKKKYEELADKRGNKTISDLIGFAPYLSNYFQVVMCHLETFIHLFESTANTIYGQMSEKEGNKRHPLKLGIRNLQVESDVPSSVFKQVPPFPGVYKNEITANENLHQLMTGENIVHTSWVGDFKGPTDWEEEKLVDDLCNALKIVSSSVGDFKKTRRGISRNANNYGLSYIPSDYVAEFPMYATKDKESMAFYTAMRAELLFGIMDTGEIGKDDNICELIGAMDGYNFASQCSDGNVIRSLIGDGEGETAVEEIKNIVFCKNKGNGDRYAFEFAKTSGNRHPVFAEEGDTLKYKYMETRKGNPIVPLDNTNALRDSVIQQRYVFGTDKKFKVKDLVGQSYVFGGNTDDFLNSQLYDSDEEVPKDELYGYRNSNMFTIVTDGEAVKSMIASTKEASSSQNFGNYAGSLFSKVRDRYTLTDENNSLYRNKAEAETLGKGYSESGITQDFLLNDDGALTGKMVGATTANTTNEFINQFTKSLKI